MYSMSYLSNIINNIFVVKQVRFYLFFHALPKWNFNSFNFRIVSRIWLGLSDTFCTVFPSGQFFDIICRCPFIPISLKFGIAKMIMELLSSNLLIGRDESLSMQSNLHISQCYFA